MLGWFFFSGLSEGWLQTKMLKQSHGDTVPGIKLQGPWRQTPCCFPVALAVMARVGIHRQLGQNLCRTAHLQSTDAEDALAAAGRRYEVFLAVGTVVVVEDHVAAKLQ